MRDRYNRLCATRAPNYAWITSAIHGLTVKAGFSIVLGTYKSWWGQTPFFQDVFWGVRREAIEQAIVY